MGANRFLEPGSAPGRLFEDARRVIPGGTSKANFDARPHPFYFVSGRGCRVTDADGVERLDALNNFTALIHGHAFPPVVTRVSEQLARGTAFAASTPEEIDLARLLVERVPNVKQIRFGNSGTEAVMMAIKAARAFTGRDRIANASLFRLVMTAGVPRTYRDTVEPAADRRLSRLFLHLLDAGVLVGANGLGCLSTPMGEREIDEIAEATARALHVLARET